MSRNILWVIRIFSLDAEIKQKSEEISSSQALLNDGPRSLLRKGPRSPLRKGPRSPLGKSPQATGEPKVYKITRAAMINRLID